MLMSGMPAEPVDDLPEMWWSLHHGEQFVLHAFFVVSLTHSTILGLVSRYHTHM